MKNLFVINESEKERILNLHINATKKNYLFESGNLLNEGIPGLSNAIKVGMKQGFEGASLVELKKMLKQSNPSESNIDNLFTRFEDEYLASTAKDDVIEKYFKNTSDDILEDFITILVKQNPAKFARYSADAVMGGEFSRVVRYAAEKGDSYSVEKLKQVKDELESYINDLDGTDPFTLEVKHTFENEYLKKLDDKIESKGGSSKPKDEPIPPKPDDEPVIDADFNIGTSKFEQQIEAYLPPNNRWDKMADFFGSVPVVNRATSKYVKELNALEKKIGTFDGTLSSGNNQMFIDFIEAYTSTKTARDINSKQLERMYRTLSSKLSPDQASVLKKFSDVASGKIKFSDLGNTGNKNIDTLLSNLGKVADKSVDKGFSILKKTGKYAKYSGEWVIMGLILWYLLSKLSSVGGGGASDDPWSPN
jgi:F0F1-type ATP synthase delta subunit